MSFRGLDSKRFPTSEAGFGGQSRKATAFAERLVDSNNPYVAKFEEFASSVEEYVDTHFDSIKPYVPAIGRFLIVATFLEDSVRIFSQWDDQVYYLATFRHLWVWFVKLFLVFNISLMVSASVMIITRVKTEIAACLLTAVVVFQGFIYGLFFDPVFFFRNISVVGGLLIALSDSLVRDKRFLSMPGLPMVESKDNKKYFLLAGRIMLILLFLVFAFKTSWSFFRLFVVLVGFFACSAVVVGYKTKFAAVLLVVLFSIYNISSNHYWTYGQRDARRDYLKYEFFQTLSIVGGLLIILNTGAGELSLDEKKKIY
ncbi:unnamed protein product [Kuraishia capsulata CBS 1993]|uniref:ER-derived vesicles protein ERV29 n=1 Tax=Kuraishia capsulata CBS 1993 TaxID=1382522 RepID=W6MT12_9ASCO|nr:uncharacterized protein KUCA_T00005858001 [Kuraishia capsulata CBS 1993]CDK29864.1 unnamed protein product [Kuraishia capsulata CBS 1993]